ncbi:hypothetical protein NWF34_06980 [Gordonia sp. GONU]|uniref:hypothetical protein n=1 Tax=Gordonia sp. GONU TaxID=2972949 RepID=UPI0021AD09B4|nr:hypothetical protein [Gordonia sp. GONU]MCR8896701.1 hypothetical protein [Gordonia sp. GONU]
MENDPERRDDTKDDDGTASATTSGIAVLEKGAEPATAAGGARGTGTEVPGHAAGDRARGHQVSLRSVIVGGVILALVAALGLVSWQLHSRSEELTATQAAATAESQAEKVALDYAKGAAAIDFKDLPAWRSRLTEGTSEEMAARLTQAATSMEQIVTPLQWTSTAEPIAAVTTSVDGDVYSVDCFVGVTTKNTQTPDGIQSTATYKLRLDKSKDWKIVDISGVNAELPTGGR